MRLVRTNNILLICVLALLCSGCFNRDVDIEGIWIETSNVRYSNRPKYSIKELNLGIRKEKDVNGLYVHETDPQYQSDNLFLYTEDSIYIKRFTDSMGPIYFPRAYDLLTDSIRFYVDSESKTFKHSYIEKNRMSISFFGNSEKRILNDMKVSYLKLENYNMGNRELEFLDFIQGDPLTFGDRIIRFLPGGQPNYGEYEFYHKQGESYNNYWSVEKVDNELFIYISNQLIHITNFGDGAIEGLSYREEPEPRNILMSKIYMMNSK